MGSEYANYVAIQYAGKSGSYYFGGNPILAEETYDPARNALNSVNGDQLTKVGYTLIRNAAQVMLSLESDGGHACLDEVQVVDAEMTTVTFTAGDHGKFTGKSASLTGGTFSADNKTYTISVPVGYKLQAADISAVEADSGLMWNELEMEQGTDEVVVAPLCLEFNALGIVWDETQPEAPACQFVGILRPQVQALRESCGSRVEQMAEQMKIVADKSRLEILMALRAAPLCGQELSRQVGLSAGTISHHMACLVREGFVAMSKRGSRVAYELRRGKLEELLDALRASLI